MTTDNAGRRIDALRLELERVDRDIVDAVSRRQRLVETVAAVKQQSGAPLRDRLQETAVLARAESAARELGADPFLIGRLFRELIAHSVRVQEVRALEWSPAPDGQTMTVGYQGAEDAPSHLAAQRHFSFHRGGATYHAFSTFTEVAQAVADGKVTYGVLPIENSTAGSINETYDLLSMMELSIVGEEILTDERRPGETAPGSQAPLFRGESQPHAGGRTNLTRFVVVAQSPIECAPRVACKTSIIFIARHEQGMLLQCLNALADRALNLSKLESRPRPGSPWEYQFYVDFDGNLADPAVQDALADLERRTLQVRVLGCYPSRTGSEGRIERVSTSRDQSKGGS